MHTDRVLMYQDDLDAALDALLTMVRPGGRLVAFEFDYGSLILDHGSGNPAAVRAVEGLLERSLPQPRAGRRLPSILAARGLAVTAEPLAVGADVTVFRRIIGDTVRAAGGDADPVVRRWLAHAESGAVPLPVAVTGVLTTATVAG